MKSQSLVLLSVAQRNEVEKALDEGPRSPSKFARTLGFSVRPKKGVVISIDTTDCFALPSSQFDLQQFKTADALSLLASSLRHLFCSGFAIFGSILLVQLRL